MMVVALSMWESLVKWHTVDYDYGDSAFNYSTYMMRMLFVSRFGNADISRLIIITVTVHSIIS